MTGLNSDYDTREQTRIKHLCLKLYLDGATRILGSVYNIFKYTDCCAGPWESKSPQYQDTSFGIACKVMDGARGALARRGKQVQFSALLVEKEASAYKELCDFAARMVPAGIAVRVENWDFTAHTPAIAAYCGEQGGFPFLFIDPWGWKVAGISAIKPLLQIKPGEVLINLMSSFIARFVDHPGCNLSDLLGTDAPEIRKLTGSEREYASVRKYCDLVKSAGDFKYVCALPVMSSQRDAISFYLVYATRHEKGVTVFKDVERRAEKATHEFRAEAQQRRRQSKTENLELFTPEVRYHETKYQELSRFNQARAKERVLQMLQDHRRIRYDECWAEALQFSAVYERDIRGWLASWEASQIILVEGRKKSSEMLKIKHQHFISYIA